MFVGLQWERILGMWFWQHPYSEFLHADQFSRSLVVKGLAAVEEAVEIAVHSCKGFLGWVGGFHANSCSQRQKETSLLLH
jgi:hypothetical protein